MIELRDTIAGALVVEGNAFSSVSDRQKQEMSGQVVIVEGTERGFSDSVKSYVDLENCIVS